MVGRFAQVSLVGMASALGCAASPSPTAVVTVPAPEAEPQAAEEEEPGRPPPSWVRSFERAAAAAKDAAAHVLGVASQGPQSRETRIFRFDEELRLTMIEHEFSALGQGRSTTFLFSDDRLVCIHQADRPDMVEALSESYCARFLGSVPTDRWQGVDGTSRELDEAERREAFESALVLVESLRSMLPSVSQPAPCSKFVPASAPQALPGAPPAVEVAVPDDLCPRLEQLHTRLFAIREGLTSETHRER